MLTLGLMWLAFRASKALISAWIEPLSSPAERANSRQSGSSGPVAAFQSTGLASGRAVRMEGSNGVEIQPFWPIGWPSMWA